MSSGHTKGGSSEALSGRPQARADKSPRPSFKKNSRITTSHALQKNSEKVPRDRKTKGEKVARQAARDTCTEKATEFYRVKNLNFLRESNIKMKCAASYSRYTPVTRNHHPTPLQIGAVTACFLQNRSPLLKPRCEEWW